MPSGLIQDVCRRYWASRSDGRQEPIEEFLSEVPDADRQEALFNLLRMELRQLMAAGQPIEVDDYRRRFHDDVDVLDRVFGELKMWAHCSPSANDRLSDTATFSDVAQSTDLLPTGVSPSAGLPPPPLGVVAPPTHIGRYQIVEIAGRGGFGAVYKAFDPKLQRTVAVKVPRTELLDDQPELKRFLREAQAVAGLSHPHICPVFDVGDVDGRHYIVMAYVEGTSLSDVLKRQGPLSEDEAFRIVRSVAEALHAAHEQGILHRDLKPSNIMIAAGGKPVVMDFGLAVRTHSNDPRLTQSGALVGTPAYMSPEQLRGETEIGPASDVYSLGVVLYELVTGQRPFSGKTLADIIASALSATAAAPSSLNPAASSQTDAICARAMSKDPSERFSSMREFAEALGEPLGEPSPARSGRRSPLIVRVHHAAIAGGVGILLIIAGVVFLTSRGDPYGDSTTPPPGDLDFTLIVHRNGPRRDLPMVVPVFSEELISWEFDLPPAAHAECFVVNGEGQLKFLKEIESHSAPQAVYFPQQGQALRLTGAAGTEFMFVCGSRSAPVDPERVEQLWIEATTSQWPALPEMAVVYVRNSDVQFDDVTGRDLDLDEPVEISNPARIVQQRLKKFSLGLLREYDFVNGVAFAHVAGPPPDR